MVENNDKVEGEFDHSRIKPQTMPNISSGGCV